MKPIAALAVASVVALTGRAAAAPTPAAVLIAAEQRSAAASSYSVDLTIVAAQGGRTTTAHLAGTDDQAHGRGRYTLTLPDAPAGHSPSDELVAGTTVYVHYPLLDTLHASDSRVKHWVVGDAPSTLGVGTWSLGSDAIAEIHALTGLHATGTTTDAGVTVTRYQGDVQLSAAPPLAAQFEQVLGPTSASTVARGVAGLELQVGADGRIHRSIATLALGVAGSPAVSVRLSATFARFGEPVAPIRVPTAADVMTPSTLQKLQAASAAPADAALLGKVVLAPAQVGAGYSGALIPGGTEVQGQATLDFCGLSYPSEGLRSARLQVRYTATGMPFEASNEVVTYTAGGAQQALRELRRALATCPTGHVKRNAVGSAGAMRSLRTLADPRLLPGSVALLDDETATVGGKPVTVGTVAVYQVRGRVLSGVYVIGGSDAGRVAFALHAAERAAANLRAHA